ncbi:hypothetical protein GN244_ATG04772 [Phytophthora infestans]|uniref:Uncharacterized protein n=1 Tax=Phytophthora infestans TaxID=4787 RepID=A0A833SLW0_PHYIN|nr:hypothetical protein GN244_ATG04772 [Phytophthora infestans]
MEDMNTPSRDDEMQETHPMPNADDDVMAETHSADDVVWETCYAEAYAIEKDVRKANLTEKVYVTLVPGVDAME